MINLTDRIIKKTALRTDHFVRVANKILNVNTLIYWYFIGSHDAFASWWHFHVPYVDQKNASNLASLVEIECVSETNVLYF